MKTIEEFIDDTISNTLMGRKYKGKEIETAWIANFGEEPQLRIVFADGGDELVDFRERAEFD